VLAPKVLIIALLLALPGAVVVSSNRATECAAVSKFTGTCATTDGTGVQLKATDDVPGTGSGTRGNTAPGATASKPKHGATTATRPCGTLTTKCKAVPNPAIGQRDGFTVTGPVHLSDLIGFAPTPGVDHMEPGGWSVVGLDTNFFATANSEVQTGVLLGKPASVRFTARAFRWVYGDGSAATLAGGGATWKALGLSSFDPTPTSHRYQREGTYAIDLTIEFGAEYRYTTDDWIRIAGTLAVPANRLTTTVGTAKTVLVARDCVQDPHGPGC
jgi:hypothetical protein